MCSSKKVYLPKGLLHLSPMFCIHFELLLSAASWHWTETVCVSVRACVCACARPCLSVGPSTCAYGFICHMPRALWNRGTIIHSSGLQHQCLPASLIYGLIYTSDTGSPPSQNPCWHKTGALMINPQMLHPTGQYVPVFFKETRFDMMHQGTDRKQRRYSGGSKAVIHSWNQKVGI